MRPRLPSSIRSPRLIPRLPYFFAILTTSLRLLRTNCSLAHWSFSSVTSLPNERSSSALSSDASSISFRYSFMVTSNAIAHSRPAKNLSAQAIRANCGSTLPPFYRTFGSLPETNLFEVSVKYASGFTTLKFFPSHLTRRVADFSRGLYHTVGYRVSNGGLAHKIPSRPLAY